MYHVFGEGSLWKENRDATLRVAAPGKCSAEEIIHGPH